MSRSDRTNQEKVDAILGKGKFKAGSAEANLALANYFKTNPAAATTPTTASANPLTPGRPGQPTGSQSSSSVQTGGNLAIPGLPTLSKPGSQSQASVPTTASTPPPPAAKTPISAPKNRAEAATAARKRGEQQKVSKPA